MVAQPPDKPDLTTAFDTDEIYRLAYDLAAWGLRNGECTEADAVDWVLDHPREEKLPRGSRGGLNPTLHHVTKGAEAAVSKYAPWVYHERVYDPAPLHALAERISGSGVKHERYLLGVVALCHRFETSTPVITGPLLAEVVGVGDRSAGSVLNEWGQTLASGFFTGVTYDGKRGHGRVWSVDLGWEPKPKPKHLPGCNRSKARCKCPGLSEGVSQNDSSIIYSCKQIDEAKCDSTRERDLVTESSAWLSEMDERTPVTVTDVCRRLGITRAAATKLLRDHEGGLLAEGTYPGGRRRVSQSDGTYKWIRQGETWFVA